jgi:hypothetical protein
MALMQIAFFFRTGPRSKLGSQDFNILFIRLLIYVLKFVRDD